MKKSIFFISIFILSVFLNCNDKCGEPKEETLNIDLVAHYPFNKNTNDESIYHNNAKKNGGDFVSDQNNSTGSAYYFNGVQDYLTAASGDQLNIRDAITISVWIKPITTHSQYIVTKAASLGGGGPYSLDIYSGTIRVILYGEAEKNLFLEGKNLIKPGVWQHILLTWDGSLVKTYYNGILDSSAPYNGKLLTSTGELQIATYLWGKTYYNGIIDNIRIYKRGLSEDEIQRLYVENK